MLKVTIHLSSWVHQGYWQAIVFATSNLKLTLWDPGTISTSKIWLITWIMSGWFAFGRSENDYFHSLGAGTMNMKQKKRGRTSCVLLVWIQHPSRFFLFWGISPTSWSLHERSIWLCFDFLIASLPRKAGTPGLRKSHACNNLLGCFWFFFYV